MPVPQKKLSLVERASCPFFRMMQDVSYILPFISASLISHSR
ncbi:hypothetical protein QUB16_09705 [Microcoleus sp. D3_18a_C4]